MLKKNRRDILCKSYCTKKSPKENAVVVPTKKVDKGELYLGHHPDLISKRFFRYTCSNMASNERKHIKLKCCKKGNKRVIILCKDVFFQSCKQGKSNIPAFKLLKSNARTLENPQYVDNEGYLKLETLTIPLDGIDRNVNMSFSQLRHSIYGIYQILKSKRIYLLVFFQGFLRSAIETS